MTQLFGQLNFRHSNFLVSFSKYDIGFNGKGKRRRERKGEERRIEEKKKSVYFIYINSILMLILGNIKIIPYFS